MQSHPTPSATQPGPRPHPTTTRPQSLFEELAAITMDPLLARAVISIAEAQAKVEGGAS